MRVNFNFAFPSAKKSLSHMMPCFSLVDKDRVNPVNDDSSALTCH